MPYKKALLSRKDIHGMNSGTSLLLFQQAKALRDLGYEVYAIAEKFEAVENADCKLVKTLRWPFSGYFRRRFYAGRVASWVRRNKPDIVIGNGDIFHQDILVMHNCTHLAHELVYGEAVPSSHQTGRLHSNIFTNGSFKMLVCNSALMQRDFALRFKVPKEKSCIIYPSVDITNFSMKNPQDAAAEYRTKLGFNQDDLVLGLITSGDFKKRNVELLIRTLAALKGEFRNAKLLVAGKDKKESYMALATELGVGANIVFAPPIKDVKYYYNMVDIFVLPAFIEEFGISALEAMASAKPVILGANVGASEILEAHQREFILRKLNVAGLFEKLRPLAISVDLRRDMGELNRQTAAKYDGERLRKAYSAVVEKVSSKGEVAEHGRRRSPAK